MLWYFSIYIITAFFAFFRVHNKILFGLFCTFLTFFIGFRHEVGADWGNYIEMRRLIITAYEFLGWKSLSYFGGSPFYGLLNVLLPNIYWVNFLGTIVFMSGFFVFFKNKPNPFLALSVALSYLIYVVGMNYNRQAISVGFVLWALRYFEKQHFITYIFLIILAIGFHPSAFITIGLLLTLKKFQSKSGFIIVSITLLLLSIASTFIFSRLEGYTNSNSTYSSSGAIYRLFLSAVTGVFVLFNRKFFFTTQGGTYKNILRILAWGSIILFFGSFVFSTLSDRAGVYFLIIQPLTYALFTNRFNLLSRYIFITSILVFYAIFMFYWFSSSFWAQHYWLNYQNYLLLN